MGFEHLQNDHLNFEDFRKFIGQVVREEIRALVAPEIKSPEEVRPKEINEVYRKPNSNWLTHSEAAAFLKTTPAVLYKLSSLRKIRYSKRGKKNYYKVEHLEQYLTEGEIPTRERLSGKQG